MDEDLITKIIINFKLLLLLFCIFVAFYVIKIYYCFKIINMHVHFRFHQACMGQTQLVKSCQQEEYTTSVANKSVQLNE